MNVMVHKNIVHTHSRRYIFSSSKLESEFGLPLTSSKATTPRPRLGIHKGIKWNEIYLSKGKELNGMELSNLDWMFKNKGMKMNGM